MRGFWFLPAGALIGAALTHAVMTASDALDQGVARTHRCDQLAREDDARRSAAKILEHLLRDRTLPDLRAIAEAAGLQMDQFDKGDHAEIVVGHSPGTAGLTFTAPAGGISVHALPGSAPCDASANTR